MDDTSPRMSKIVREHLGLDRDPKDEDQMRADLGCDSLDKVELTMAAEEEFGCNVPDMDNDPDEDMTFGKFVAHIDQARQA